jgi:succinate-acetate transporter protein
VGVAAAAFAMLISNEKWFFAGALACIVLAFLLMSWCNRNPANPVARFLRGIGTIVVSMVIITFGTTIIMLLSFSGADIAADLMAIRDQQQIFVLRAIGGIIGAIIFVSLAISELSSTVSKLKKQ